jgi:hypothetical protein
MLEVLKSAQIRKTCTALEQTRAAYKSVMAKCDENSFVSSRTKELYLYTEVMVGLRSGEVC